MDFATPLELATHLQTATQDEADAGSSDVLDTSIALQAIATATGEIRGVCGWSITQETDVTLTVDEWSQWVVFLPTLYLTAVGITVDSAPLTADVDFRFKRNGTVRLNRAYVGWLCTYQQFAGPSLVVTYTHGFAEVPAAVKAVCLDLAAAKYFNPERKAATTYGSASDRWSLPIDLLAEPRLGPFVRLAVG